MRRRSIFALLATIALGLGITPAHAELADIKERGTLRVAVPQDFPPFGSAGLDMQPIGYDIDMAAAIAEHLDVELELIPVTSANRVPYLQTDRVDLVISSLGKNEERMKVIDFTQAYAPFYNGIFGDDSFEGGDVAALAGKTVGVTRGSVEDLALTELVGPDVTVNRYEDNNGTISAFLSGQVDVIATGNVVAAAILERNPPRSPELKFLISNSPCYIGLNKNQPELLAAVDGVIAEMKADGSLNAISQKWLKADLPADL